ERQSAEETQESRRQPLPPQGGLRARFLRADFSDWQIAVQFAHDLAHRRGERGRFALRAQGERHLADHFDLLPPGGVKQWLDLFTLAHVFDVSHDTDDLDFTLVGSKPDTLAERIKVGEILLRKGLIDDGNSGRALIVLR